MELLILGWGVGGGWLYLHFVAKSSGHQQRRKQGGLGGDKNLCERGQLCDREMGEGWAAVNTPSYQHPKF